MKVKYDYKTTLPNEANAPSVTIYGNSENEFSVLFYCDNKLVSEKFCKCGETVYANHHQYFSDWHIVVELGGEVVSEDRFNPNGKVIFIKMDAHALGDNIAWIPYVEEFRKKHNCTVICSTFYNQLFKDIYPNILFVAPNTNIENIYAQYYIGAKNEDDTKYSPIKCDETSLQSVASKILGLETCEIRPQIDKMFPQQFRGRYVCISEHASSDIKRWRFEGGWQQVVDYIKTIGFDICVISKEPTNLSGVINLTGDTPIYERAELINGSSFFIGVSSGLSWLSWAVNTHVFLISDVTPIKHEFVSGVTRISANPSIEKIDYNSPGITNPENVISEIEKYLLFQQNLLHLIKN